jgi:ABC-type transport system involved in cytochrome bd biosynthesis fused ATPase/permease subunit
LLFDALTFGDRGDDSRLRERLERRNLLPLLSGIPQDPEQPLGRSFQGGHELSAGQWRRLLLARTLLRDASLYVLDEPFAFLDAAARHALVQWLDAMRGNATVVLVEHRVPDGLSFDRTIALSHGETPAT